MRIGYATIGKSGNTTVYGDIYKTRKQAVNSADRIFMKLVREYYGGFTGKYNPRKSTIKEWAKENDCIFADWRRYFYDKKNGYFIGTVVVDMGGGWKQI